MDPIVTAARRRAPLAAVALGAAGADALPDHAAMADGGPAVTSAPACRPASTIATRPASTAPAASATTATSRASRRQHPPLCQRHRHRQHQDHLQHRVHRAAAALPATTRSKCSMPSAVRIQSTSSTSGRAASCRRAIAPISTARTTPTTGRRTPMAWQISTPTWPSAATTASPTGATSDMLKVQGGAFDGETLNSAVADKSKLLYAGTSDL